MINETGHETDKKTNTMAFILLPTPFIAAVLGIVSLRWFGWNNLPLCKGLVVIFRYHSFLLCVSKRVRTYGVGPDYHR
jgi:hypothetical protein